jgi:hypothetical protein
MSNLSVHRGDRNSSDESVPQGKDYRDYGRAFARLGDPFEKVFDIVQCGLEMEKAILSRDSTEPESDS